MEGLGDKSRDFTEGGAVRRKKGKGDGANSPLIPQAAQLCFSSAAKCGSPGSHATRAPGPGLKSLGADCTAERKGGRERMVD